MARNFANETIREYKKLRCYGQDAGAFYIKHDTFISKGREETLKVLKKVKKIENEEKEVQTEAKPPVKNIEDDQKEVKTIAEPLIEEEVEAKEMTPEDEDILVDGALMTSKAIQARNKALAKKSKYKQIRRIDQSEIENKALDNEEIKPMPQVSKVDKIAVSAEKNNNSMSYNSDSGGKYKLQKLPPSAEIQRKQVNPEMPVGKLPPKTQFEKLKTIDQIKIIVPEDRKGFQYVEKPSLCCTVC